MKRRKLQRTLLVEDSVLERTPEEQAERDRIYATLERFADGKHPVPTAEEWKQFSRYRRGTSGEPRD